MNTLSLGFIYVVGVSWLLCEVTLSGAHGNWTPFWLFWAGFTVVFATLGCWPMSRRGFDLVGSLSSIAMGIAIMLYGVGSFDASVLGAVLRLFGGLVVATVGVLGILSMKTEKAH